MNINQTINQLTQRIPELMNEVSVPGLSIALIYEGEIAWTDGFGVLDLRTKELVTTETYFEGCSLSKPPFAYAALKLHEQNVIDLDTPLVSYLSEPYDKFEPDVKDDPRLPLITMRNVLCHMCGLPNWARKDETLKIRLDPNTRFSYSGEGYMYLQRVIEQIRGQLGEDFMQSSLLQPLGMTKSTYIWSKENEPSIATGHKRKGEPADKFYMDTMWSAASLHTTPTDFAKFMVAMMNPNDTIADLMLAPQIYVNDSAPWHKEWPDLDSPTDERVSWGLGWGIQHQEPHDSFWHWGDNFTFTAFAAGFRETGSGVVIMTNSPNGYALYEQVCQLAIGGEYPGLWWLRRLFSD